MSSATAGKGAPGEGLKVLVIDDEAALAETVAEALGRIGYDCTVARSGKAGAAQIAAGDFDVVITDLKMADLDGLAILRKAREELPDAEVIMITGYGDVKTAVEAIKQGASHFLTKPPDLQEIRAIVNKASERLRLARANRELQRQLSERFGFEGVVGNSPRMHDLVKRLQAIAPTNSTVLILGETGTGKDLLANALHENSPRRNKRFVPINCTALNESLIDDELFGHEPGSYTSADRRRMGKFEYADGGTLFLDEIGDMPLPLQAKLLRVLENRELTRIGGNEPIKVNVRVISATHQDLEARVAEGKFRNDLYQRLRVVTVKIPPLRDRREDIPLLCAKFLKDFNAAHGKNVRTIAEPVRRAMAAYDWPGNVRELKNTVESMVLFDTDGVLGLDDVQEGDFLRKMHLAEAPPAGADGLVGRPLSEVERYYIEQALQRTGGNREEAARVLGIGERTLYRVIQDWKLQDRIKAALAEADGDMGRAAAALGMRAEALERKIKKMGMRDDDGE